MNSDDLIPSVRLVKNENEEPKTPDAIEVAADNAEADDADPDADPDADEVEMDIRCASCGDMLSEHFLQHGGGYRTVTRPDNDTHKFIAAH